MVKNQIYHEDKNQTYVSIYYALNRLIFMDQYF